MNKIFKIPYLGFLLLIMNSHAYGGDYLAFERIAPAKLWIKRFISPILFSSAIVAIILNKNLIYSFGLPIAFVDIPKNNFLSDPGGLLLSVLPNLLGFGIGVYALLFSLSTLFIKNLDSSIKNSNAPGSVLSINVDMAYPLMNCAWSILIGFFQKAFPENATLYVFAWFSFVYTMLTMLDLIRLLFDLSTHVVFEKIDEI